MQPDPRKTPSVTPARIAVASLVVSAVVFVLKAGAWWSSGAVVLLADAVESALDGVTALMVVGAVVYASRPADRGHPWGHGKVEYFSAGFQGALILGTGGSILFEAIRQAGVGPAPLELGAALGLSGLATFVNTGLAVTLIRLGRANRSPALVADGWHNASDVATTAGGWLGLALAWGTGAWILDPIVAGLIGLHVLWTGVRLGRDAARGLMDSTLPNEELDALQGALDAVLVGFPGTRIDGLRARRSSRDTFVECVLEVPGEMSVREAHRICDALEEAARTAVDGAELIVHTEPARASG